jgi:hypothetical protein
MQVLVTAPGGIAGDLEKLARKIGRKFSRRPARVAS